MDQVVLPRISDGHVAMRPMIVQDAAAHLAWEDDQTRRFLSGGTSTMDTVTAWISRNQDSWLSDGPIRSFALLPSGGGDPFGMVEINLQPVALRRGVANISYGLAAAVRGRGFATRSVLLAVHYLRLHTTADTALIQTDRENVRSSAVARRAGFTYVGDRTSADGDTLTNFLLPLR